MNCEVPFVKTKQKEQLRNDNNKILIRVEIDCPPHIDVNTGKVFDRDHIHFEYEENGEWKKRCINLVDFDKCYFNNKDVMSVFLDVCKICNIDSSRVNKQGFLL